MFDDLINAAVEDANSMIAVAGGRPVRKGTGYARIGRYAVAVVLVGRPSTGRSSPCSTRLDCYLDGRRVSRAVLTAALRGQV